MVQRGSWLCRNRFSAAFLLQALEFSSITSHDLIGIYVTDSPAGLVLVNEAWLWDGAVRRQRTA